MECRSCSRPMRNVDPYGKVDYQWCPMCGCLGSSPGAGQLPLLIERLLEFQREVIDTPNVETKVKEAWERYCIRTCLGSK